MKKLGIMIIVIGLVTTIFAGANLITKEKVVEIDSIDLMADKENSMDWSPYLGLGIMAVGFAFYWARSSGQTTLKKNYRSTAARKP